MSSEPLWLVGYLFNTNGMGAWCLEAAQALAADGQRVILVHSSGVLLPAEYSVRTICVDVDPLPPSGPRRWFSPGGIAAGQGPRVIRKAIDQLQQQGERVDRVLLNSTEFIDPMITAPQGVVAWASGIRLADYLWRQRIHAGRGTSAKIRSIAGTIGWWRRDVNGYRHADLLLPVTHRLANELMAEVKTPVHAVYPCIGSASHGRSDHAGPVRLLIVAADLGEKRKRIAWMLRALQDCNMDYQLTVAGHFDPDVVRIIETPGSRANYAGSLDRDGVFTLMEQSDVLLFGSVLDDWGYVLTEAMARGCAVVAPDIPPFDEVVGDAGIRYEADSSQSFIAAVSATASHVESYRMRGQERVHGLFSRKAFARSVRAAFAGAGKLPAH